MKIIATITLVYSLCACGGVKKENVVLSTNDSIITQSQRHIENTNVILDSADYHVSESVHDIVIDIQKLKIENEKLKSESSKLKKRRVRVDTIYVIENKNLTKDSTTIN
jgi:hypothetical protein